jgi:glycosyltransferase involved in cell wall biosynthesis
MKDRPVRPSVLHVIVRAGATNSQYNEHCLPVLGECRITVASLFPADVTPPPELRLVEGDGSLRGSLRAIRLALDLGPYEVVHVHAPVSGILTLLVYLRTLRSRRNLVFTVHNSWRNFRPRNRLFLYLILFFFPTIVMCGAAAARSLPRVLRWIVRPRLSVIPNGVDIDRVDRTVGASNGVPRAQDSFSVVSVNRLIPLKDPWTVLQAFERLRDPAADLALVGDGELHDGLLAGIHISTARERIWLTGIVPREDVYRLMSTADVFVSASGGEGLPVAVLEAMACGCPVVLSDIAPHREIAAVAPEIPLVRVGDVDGFTRALAKLRAYSPAERRELGHRQRKCVAELFSVRSMNEAYRELYMQLTDSNHGSGGPPRQPAWGQPEGGDVVGLVARMRARLGMCIVLTLLGALAGFGYAQTQAPTYEAKLSLLIGDIVGGPADQEALDASAALAATYADLVRREPVLEPVAEAGYADDWQALQSQVHAQVGDKNPQLVQVTVDAPRAYEAEDLARAIGEQVVVLSEDAAKDQRSRFFESQLLRLEGEINEIQDTIDAVSLDLNPDADADTVTEQSRQLRKLEDRREDLNEQYTAMVTLSTQFAEGAKVEVLENAYASRDPLRPDQLSLVAAGAGLGLACAAGVAYFAGRRRRPVRVDRSAPAVPRAGHISEPGFEAGPVDDGRLFDELAGEPTRPGGRP